MTGSHGDRGGLMPAIKGSPRSIATLGKRIRLVVGAWIIVAGGLSGLAAAATASVAPASTVYVADAGSSSLTPVLVPTGIAGRAIRMYGLLPVAVAVTPNGGTVYVVAVGSDEDGSPGSVIAVDARTETLANPMAVGSSPQAILIAPDGKTAYVLGGIDAATTPGTSQVTVTPIDTASNIAARPINVGTLPTSMLMSPNGKLIYVLDTSPSENGEATEITPIETATNRAGPPIKVAARAVAFAPNSETAYATNSLLGVVPIDTSTGRPGKAIGTLPSVPIDIAASPDGKHVEVLGTPDPGLEKGSPDANDWTLTSINTASGRVGAVIRLGANIGSSSGIVAVAPGRDLAYVLVQAPAARESTVIPVNLTADTVGKAIAVGKNAVTMAIASNGSTVYVLDGGSYHGLGSPRNTPGALVQISTTTDSVSKSTPVGIAPLAFAIAPAVSAAPLGGGSGAKNLVVTDAVRSQLVASFASAHHLPVREVGGTYPGSVFYAYDEATRTDWATASFYPTTSDPLTIKDTFQDAGSNGIFSRAASGSWRFRGSGAPLLCAEEREIPSAVLAAWGTPKSSPGCTTR